MIAPLAPDAGSSGIPAGTPLMGTTKVSQQTAAAIVRRQDLDVTITTADGDRFTLSADSVSAGVKATYSELGATATNVHMTQSSVQSFFSERSASLSIEGNFDRSEMRDIGKAFKEIGKILRDAGSGHFKQSAQRVERLAKLDTLSGIQANYQYATVAAAEQSTSVESLRQGDPSVTV